VTNEMHAQHVLRWLLTEPVGSSSKAMAAASIGMPSSGAHPHDPDDLSRCLRLLQCAPGVRDRMSMVAAMNPAWTALVARWGEIETLAVHEGVDAWAVSRRRFEFKPAVRTYALLKEVLTAGGAR